MNSHRVSPSFDFLSLTALFLCISYSVPALATIDLSDSGQSLGSGSSRSVALGDLDGDGDLDAFVAQEAGSSGRANRVWLNDGAGNFSDSGQLMGLADSWAVALGDLDGDGDLDAFVGNGNSVVGEANQVWINDGSGTFSAGQTVGSSPGLPSFAVALGDVDADGNLDAVVGNSGSATAFTRIWLGVGDGTFTLSPFNFGSLGTVQTVGLGDLDGDGDPDAIFGTFGGGTKIWLNDGAGTFSNAGTVPSGVSFSVLGDIDADSDLDLFIPRRSLTPNYVWKNNGNATFFDTGQALGNAISYGAALGDFDGDGSLDAFVVNAPFSTVATGANVIWQNDGTGTYSDSGVALGTSTSWSVALGDVDADGDLDAFVGNSGPDRVWLNESALPVPLYSDSGQSLGGGSSKSVALGDVDDDGDLDAFVGMEASTPNKVWLNDGSGVFSDSLQALGAAGSLGVALADVDADGDLDAFVANGNGVSGEPNRIWLGNGDGTFSAGQTLGNLASFSVALGDVDGDDRLDAVVGNISGHVETVWLGNGDGTFSLSAFNFGDLGTIESVALADLDRDNDLDVAFGTAGFGTRVWRNDGTGVFSNAGQTGSGVSYTVAGGLDKDDGIGEVSDLDLFVARRGVSGNLVLENDGSAVFSQTGQDLGASNSWGAALGDVDLDGDLDAFVSNAGQANTVWLNDGNGSFTDSGLELGSASSFAVALGDLDGDADPDAFVANGGNDTVWINNSPPTTLPDVDGDGLPDVSDPCPADQDNSSCDAQGSAAAEVSEDGGTVATTNGQAEIDVPGGAVAEGEVVTLSITESTVDEPEVDLEFGTGEGMPLAFYELEPDGFTFETGYPVTLVLVFDVTDLTQEQRDLLDIYRREATADPSNPYTYEALGASCPVVPDLSGNLIATCTVDLEHFSTYAPMAPSDSDGDGVLDRFNGEVDACPDEDATGYDVNEDGCIDTISGLVELVESLLNIGVIDANMGNSLLAKLDNAQQSQDRDNICALVNQLQAFKAQVSAQTGKKISADVAAVITGYADSVIDFVQWFLGSGESCL